MHSRIYLDYAASTPVDRRVRTAMEPYFAEKFGNSGSLHSFGQEAIAAVDMARETVACAIGANFRDVIFTGSATEANNIALRGALKAIMQNANLKMQNDRGKFKMNPASRDTKTFHFDFSILHSCPKIIVSAIEHESILETARELEREGLVEIIVIPVNREGIVNLKKLASALDERTVLVSIMHGNNEIGTIQPIAEIAKIIRDFRESHPRTSHLTPPPDRTTPVVRAGITSRAAWPLFHTDAAQAFQFLPCNIEALGIDMMTLSGQKIYGPKGVGALVMSQVSGIKYQDKKRGLRGAQNNLIPDTWNLTPILTGGGQEFGLRSGTENVPAIVGFAEAVRIAEQMRVREAVRVRSLASRAWAVIRRAAPKAKLHGPAEGSANRLPHILNVYFPKRKAEELLTALDLHGIAASAGSACAARSLEPSYVIQALGYNKEDAKQSIRFSFGRSTRDKDIDHLGMILRKLIYTRRVK